MRLKDKVAIVTGAGSGMGRTTALLFAREGAKVVAGELIAEAGQETAKLIQEARGEATFIQADVSKAADVQRMIKTAINNYGKLDILFNNAGIEGPIAPAAELSEEDWDKIISINLKGVFLGCKYAIPQMLKQGGGVIISTASIGALAADPNLPAYCASKGGVVALTKSIALDYGPQNIRINCICPGPVETPMLDRIVVHIRGSAEVFGQHTPMGRCAAPAEIANVALFLASDESSYITGSVLVVDGGRTAALA